MAYLGSLAVMFTAAFWSVDSFTGALVKEFTLDNLRELLTADVYRTIALRTLGIAVAVTLLDVVIAVPMAFYMAKVARPGARVYLVVAVLTPLWASYLVKAYAWRGLLRRQRPRLRRAAPVRPRHPRVRRARRSSSRSPTCGCRT